MNMARLADGPVVLTNLSVLIGVISDILHDIDRDKAEAVIEDIDRASSLLSLASDVCLSTVQAIEAGPDYKIGGKA
jgi:hypothetical protein